MDGDVRVRRIDRHLGAERVDAKVDLLRREPLAAPAQHADRDPGETGLARRFARRSATQRNDERDERHVVRALEEHERPAVEIEGLRTAPGVGVAARTCLGGGHVVIGAEPAAAATAAGGGGATRRIVRAESTR